MHLFSDERLSPVSAKDLIDRLSLPELAWFADKKCKTLHPENYRTYVIDVNLNYTNICKCRCKFCAFYKDENDPNSYILSIDDVLDRVKKAVEMGATQLLMQGGLTGKLKIEYFEDLFRAIKSNYDICIHSLSPPEILHIAECSNLNTIDTLERLKNAGLDSLPGGGAELLIDDYRQKLSSNKCSSEEWAIVMYDASKIGLKATATMVFGFGESMQDIISHLDLIRKIQDDTNVFTAFIPWTYQSGNTNLGGKTFLGHTYLKVLALSRIYLDNIKNIQASNLTQGREITELSLRFGANDIGGTLIYEKVVASTGLERTISEEELIDIIHSSGFTAVQRTTQYDVIKTISDNI
ncbi:MAG: CofH family radical SAM protein [Armatimonadota bacterium]